MDARPEVTPIAVIVLGAVGPPLATEVVRAILLARAASLAVGGSGIQPAIVDTPLSETLPARAAEAVVRNAGA